MKFEINLDEEKLAIIIREELRQHLKKQGILGHLRKMVKEEVKNAIIGGKESFSKINNRLVNLTMKYDKSERIYNSLRELEIKLKNNIGGNK